MTIFGMQRTFNYKKRVLNLYCKSKGQIHVDMMGPPSPFLSILL